MVASERPAAHTRTEARHARRTHPRRPGPRHPAGSPPEGPRRGQREVQGEGRRPARGRLRHRRPFLRRLPVAALLPGSQLPQVAPWPAAGMTQLTPS
ncbi:hypothetical protein SBRY_160023 [Actinacidiphila bryophytorum]|uniref:Uncharacterized protein n=1 Tax=Actinacidiphila bryophytorum TaxID=1436133 RepID=A0A9W4E6M0_9ACTN|nr:hypothetical protein SBRY_160023 [Actinacidiphila bryophytorum]